MNLLLNEIQVALLLVTATLLFDRTVPFDDAFMAPITYSPKELEHFDDDMLSNQTLVTAYQRLRFAVERMLPDGKCKDQITKRELSQILRSAHFRNWTLDGLVWLLDNNNCTGHGLMKILKYAPWSWWNTLGEYCEEKKLNYEAMTVITGFPTTKRFITDYYFRYVNTYKTRCSINQLLPLAWYKRNIAKYWHWTILQKNIFNLVTGVCQNNENERAVFNSKVLLPKEEVMKTYPKFVVKFYMYCSPEINRPWTIPQVLLWLQNCTKESADCYKNYCEVIDIASKLACESYPCLRNLLFMASKYHMTLDEDIIVFRHLLDLKAIKSDLEKYYDLFEKTIVAYLLNEDVERLNESYDRKRTNKTHAGVAKRPADSVEEDRLDLLAFSKSSENKSENLIQEKNDIPAEMPSAELHAPMEREPAGRLAYALPKTRLPYAHYKRLKEIEKKIFKNDLLDETPVLTKNSDDDEDNDYDEDDTDDNDDPEDPEDDYDSYSDDNKLTY